MGTKAMGTPMVGNHAMDMGIRKQHSPSHPLKILHEIQENNTQTIFSLCESRTGVIVKNDTHTHIWTSVFFAPGFLLEFSPFFFSLPGFLEFFLTNRHSVFCENSKSGTIWVFVK